MGFCAYEYEYTSHIVTFYNSCPQRPCGFMLHGRLLLSPSLGAERGWEKWWIANSIGNILSVLSCLLQDCALSCGAGRLQETTQKAAVWSFSWLSSWVWFWACRHNRRMFREIRCAYHFYHLRENGHCGKWTFSRRAFSSARKAAGSAIFVVLPRLQRRRNQ